jgi:hypothetical protein
LAAATFAPRVDRAVDADRGGVDVAERDASCKLALREHACERAALRRVRVSERAKVQHLEVQKFLPAILKQPPAASK